jgi:hypothetical protein
MKKAESARTVVTATGLALALLAASPALKVQGLSGLVLAADTPPAVAGSAGAANNPEGDSLPVESPAADLSYHRETYFYTASSLRDPFGSLVSGRFVSDAADRLPDIGSMDLLGVMWGDEDRFAMCEDREGQGYVLRVGDPVVNGQVSGITRDSITIRQYFFGTSTTVTLKLKPRGDNGNAKDKR